MKTLNYIKMLTEERYEELADTFEQAIDSRVEYETEHDDAGGNYSHMIREGGWAYGNGPDRLLEWCHDHHPNLAITKEEIESLEDEILDWCEYRPGHMFDRTGGNEFIVDSFTVGEVEEQFSFSYLCEMLDLDDDEGLDFVLRAKEDRRFCLRHDRRTNELLSYTNTDAVWVFYVTPEWIKDRLEGLRD
jgi:hypothetical protein